MEESKDVEISPSKKVKRSQKDPLTENTPSKKSNGNSSELIPNGTDNVPSEDLTDKDSSHLSPHAASVTLNEVTKSPKTDHTKGKTKSSQKETLKSPGKVSSPLNSPTTSSEGSFHGFEENSVSIKKESEKRKNFLTFLEDIEKKEEASSSQEDEAFIEKAKEEIVDEDMTVDADHASDSDSEQMEIDMGTDSSEKDKACERNKDSDVDVMDAESAKSSGPKMPKRVKKESLIKTEVTEGESQAPILEATLQGSEPVGKIEYCGSCGLKVDDAEDGICCDGSCERWFHLRCSGLTQAEYDELSNDANANWACPKCSGKPSPVPVPVPVANAKPLINVRKDLTNPPTPTATTKRKSIVKEGKTPKIDVSNPAYLKPFDYGWKRELVYRSTSDATPTTKRQGDIYYYTPKGKKLRSLREISDHLAGSDLTMDNFTFWKEPLGMDDPEKEIIRDAKYKLANKDPNASPAVTKKATPKITKATKTTTPKLTATVTPMDSSGATAITPKASASVTPRIVFKGKPSLGAAMKSKVVLNKTPAQQKILPGKGPNETNSENAVDKSLPSADGGKITQKDHTKSAVEEGQLQDNVVRRNKFRRYGLLANAKARTKESVGSAIYSSDSSDDCSHERATNNKKSKTSCLVRQKVPEKRKNERHNNSITEIVRSTRKPSEVAVKESRKEKQEQKSISLPFTKTPLSIYPEESLFSPNKRRPSPPEIQFRPSIPSSYGFQTSTLQPTTKGLLHPAPVLNTNISRSFETLYILDTDPPSQSSCISSSQCNDHSYDSPFVNNSDCSLKIVSVDTLNSEDESVISVYDSRKAFTTKKTQPSFRNKDIFSPCSRKVSENVTISVESSDSTDDEICSNQPPKNKILGTTSNTSIPQLKPVSSTSSLNPLSTTFKIRSDHTTHSQGNVKQATSTIKSRDASNKSAAKSAFELRFEECRKLKKERLAKLLNARRDAAELKKTLAKQRRLYLQKKAHEKKLQIKYLQLKVKIKEMKAEQMRQRMANE